MLILWHIVLLFIVSFDNSIFALEYNGPDWSYKDSESWSGNYPKCAGEKQSPIDISRENIFLALTAPMLNFSNMDAVPIRSILHNDGHKLKVEYEWTGPIPTVTGGPLMGDEYELKKIVIHWPSTHTFSNASADLGVQMGFQNSKFSTEEDAMAKPDGFVVLVYLHEIGEESEALKIILDNAENVLTTTNSSNEIPSFGLDKFPSKQSNKQYLVYKGSWDQPPCPESNLWVISTDTYTASREQVEKIKSTKLYNDDQTNVRPVQPINGRRIYMVRGNM